MKLLLEMLAMTNQCNMRCSYCDWEKEKYVLLSEEQYKVAYENLEAVKEKLLEKYSDIVIVQYSGGEPLLYPELLFKVLKLFPDKWIRVNTNGTLLTDEIMNKVKQHGKTYLAVSLDGYSYEPNKTRFGNNKSQYEQVINNIDKVIQNRIPLMILCTLNRENIEYFPEFVEILSQKYKDAINAGMLVMPTHAVTSYSVDNGAATKDQVAEFVRFIENSIDKYAILGNIREHYRNLLSYLTNGQRLYKCSIYDWALSVHFRGNHIIDDGKFLSFGCGMRGVHELGEFNVNDMNDMALLDKAVGDYKKERFDGKIELDNQISEKNLLNDKCENKCFPDWVVFDLIFNNQMSLEDAKKWFVIFQDEHFENICQDYIMNKKKEFEYENIEKLS